MPIQLTPGERLIAVMLADMMEHLKVESDVDPRQIKDLLFSNNDWALPLAVGGLFGGEGPTDHQIEETYAILDMWRGIEAALAQLAEEEKAGLDLDQFKFEGFDANNDKHYFLTKTLVELGRYSERDPVINSHSSSSLEHYRVMLERYRDARRGGGARPLSLDQLKRVVGYEER
ncbi:MAG TPA: YfbU family protein [Allosphingosinicella sp.]|nr:YfbU family protein [Allosphingosinicella sp.]